MVLEIITDIQKIRHRVVYIFLEAMIITIISVFVSYVLFPEKYVSTAIMGFITIGFVPIFNRLYSYSSYIYNYNKSFFQRHKRIIALLFYFFMGVFVTFILIYFIAPSSVSNSILTSQFGELDVISNISNSVTGQMSGAAVNGHNFRSIFLLIFKNNLTVMVGAILLSFMYGAGGLLLIAWNASVLSAVVIKDIISSFAGLPSHTFWFVLVGLYQSLLKFISYLPHGIFEILAYFVVSVAGAMFARDLFKGLFETSFKWKAIGDFLLMFLFAVLFLVIGALIEAYSFVYL